MISYAVSKEISAVSVDFCPSMENALHALNDAVKVSDGIAGLQFHSKKHISYSCHDATPKDMKWIKDRQCALWYNNHIDNA